MIGDRRRASGLLLVLLSTLCLSIAPVLIKVGLTAAVEPVTLIALRLVVAAVSFWLVVPTLWPGAWRIDWRGLACCALEMMVASSSDYDIARFGAEAFRPSPRQSDLMIVAGTVTTKMATMVERIYNQMPDPKWVIAYGTCACSGGIFNTYNTVQGVDEFLDVDVYVPGCPPRPEALLAAIIKLQDKIQGETFSKRPDLAGAAAG